MDVLRWLEDAILRLAPVITVFHKREMILIFYAEHSESVSAILSYLEPALGPP